MIKRSTGVALAAAVVLLVGCSSDGPGRTGSRPTASSMPTVSSPTVRPVTPVELPANYPVSRVPLVDGTVYYGFRLARGWDVRVQVAGAQAQQAALDALTSRGFRITEKTHEDSYGSRSYRLSDGTYVVFLSMATPEGGPYGFTVFYTVGLAA